MQTTAKEKEVSTGEIDGNIGIVAEESQHNQIDVPNVNGEKKTAKVMVF